MPKSSRSPNASRKVLVCVCCNHPDNGNFIARATNITWAPYYPHRDANWQWELELDHDDFEKGCAFTVDDSKLRLRIGRVWYPYINRTHWVGNWCWDGFYMLRPQALRLLVALKRSQYWSCTAGPTKVCDWLEKIQ